MRKRNRKILLCLSDKDFKKLEKDRNEVNMTRQQYLLDLVKKLPLIRCPKPDTAKYQELFDNDGRQINDLAHRFNKTGEIDMAEYASLVNMLHDHMSQLEDEIINERRHIESEERSKANA